MPLTPRPMASTSIRAARGSRRRSRHAHRRPPPHRGERRGENVIRNAVSTGTMWRGMEVILKGRDPRDAWAFTERICGVCTDVHALASVRSVEDAIGIQSRRNADTDRNMMALRPVRCRITWFTSITCTRSTGSTSSRRSRPIRPRPARSRSRSPTGRTLEPRLLHRRPGAAEELRRSRAAGPFANALLGTPRVQAAARGQPHGGRRTTSRRSTSRRSSSRSTPSSAGRIRTRTSWSAACRAR